MDAPKILIILGRAGSGKGTQAELLAKKFGLFYLGSGELLRARAKQDDFTGKKTAAVLKTGELMPTSVVFQICTNKLEEYKNQSGAEFPGIIFDGFLRELDEAKHVEEALAWYEWDKNIKVLLIDISREEAVARLTRRRQCVKCGKLIPFVGEYKNLIVCDKCGGALQVRTDDTAPAINRRLDIFDQEVEPVIAYFESKGLLVRINGDQSIEEVQEEILEKIS